MCLLKQQLLCMESLQKVGNSKYMSLKIGDSKHLPKNIGDSTKFMLEIAWNRQFLVTYVWNRQLFAAIPYEETAAITNTCKYQYIELINKEINNQNP